MGSKLTWRELSASEKNHVIWQYFETEDPDDIHIDIVETLQKGVDFTITRSSVAEWFDKQDAEYQHELLQDEVI
jgi:hypothetical protein